MKPLAQRQVHLDFHTSEDISGIGSMFDKEQFKRCLKKGHVNSITVFAKCHHGWAYFPSETNEMHPGLNFDLLSGMLEACKEAGVDAPVYISAGLDEKYYVKHPDHAIQFSREYHIPEIKDKPTGKYADEKPHYHILCFNSPYLDVLLTQVAEVVDKFKPIGIFLDIVAERVCYCEHCMKRARELGMDTEDDETFKKLAVITYKNYYERVKEVATAIKPDIKIFHNGGHIPSGRRELAYANTHLELESLPTGGWGYDHFPKSAKYVANLGMDFLGMTGKFHLTWGEFGGYKHPNALRYEVALSLAHGAKCSIGDQMHPYGFLDDATYESIGIAYAEAEAVEEYCYGGKGAFDIAVLMAEDYARVKNHTADVGACRVLLEGHKLFTLVDRFCDLSPYKLLIIPDAPLPYDAELTSKLKSYVAGGGKILASGAALPTDEGGNVLFDLGVTGAKKSEVKPAYINPLYNAMGISPTSYVIYSNIYEATASQGAEVVARVRKSFFNRAPEHFCSHKHTPYTLDDGDTTPALTVGKDGAYVAFDMFTEYSEIGTYIAKDILLHAIDAVLTDGGMIKTNLPSTGIVTLSDQAEKSRLVLHALCANTIGRGGDNILAYTGASAPALKVVEDLVPVYGTKFEIKTDKAVKKVTLVPENLEIPFTCEDGRVSFEIEKFTCKQVVVLDY